MIPNQAFRQDLRDDAGAWVEQASCAGVDSEMFFTSEGTPTQPPRGPHARRLEAQAKAICRSCPAREPCLVYALQTRQEFGIWGATTPYERAQILGNRWH